MRTISVTHEKAAATFLTKTVVLWHELNKRNTQRQDNEDQRAFYHQLTQIKRHPSLA